jgi:hypothetical protein
MNEQDANLKVRDSIQSIFLELMLEADQDPTDEDFDESADLADTFLDALGFKVVGVTEDVITCEITNFADLANKLD